MYLQRVYCQRYCSGYLEMSLSYAAMISAVSSALAVNLRLFLNTDCAARTDDLEKTVNYARLSKAVIRHCEESKCMLIETLAQNLATLCLEFSNLIQEVEVEVVKPAGLPNGEYASVTIHRRNAL